MMMTHLEDQILLLLAQVFSFMQHQILTSHWPMHEMLYKASIRMNDEFLSKNLRILFNDKSSIGLERGGEGVSIGESHIYMQFSLEGYQNVDFAKQSLPYNNISMTTIPLGIKTPGSTHSLPDYIDMYLATSKRLWF